MDDSWETEEVQLGPNHVSTTQGQDDFSWDDVDVSENSGQTQNNGTTNDVSGHSGSVKGTQEEELKDQEVVADDDEREVMDWRVFLTINPNHGIEAAPLPLSDIWRRLAVVGVKVEYRVGEVYGDFTKYGDVFWIGSIKQYFGYFVKVQAEGYNVDRRKKPPTRWLNYMTDCFRLGSCAGKDNTTLIPPLDVLHYVKDWRKKMVEDIAKGITIHPQKTTAIEEYKELFMPVGTEVEAINKDCRCKMKVGTIVKNVGQRVQIKYWDATDDKESGFLWCHQSSGLIAPPGWSKTIGHEIDAPDHYNPSTVPSDLILDVADLEDPEIEVEVGMKLEAVHPSFVHRIVAATVAKVLKLGYIMVSFDKLVEGNQKAAAEAMDADQDKSGMAEKGLYSNSKELHCFHVTSPLLFYCGFCEDMGIKLIPPKECAMDPFSWEKYFQDTGSVPLRALKSTRNYHHPHGFKIGMKLESADLIETNYICLATIVDVKERLIKINFDGWSEDFDQWMDCLSYDIFPIGWCDSVSYPMQAPNGEAFWEKYKKSDPKIFISRTFEDFLGLSSSTEYKRSPNTNGGSSKRSLEKGKNSAQSPDQKPGRKFLKADPSCYDHERTKAEAVTLGRNRKDVMLKPGVLKELRMKLSGPKSP